MKTNNDLRIYKVKQLYRYFRKYKMSENEFYNKIYDVTRPYSIENGLVYIYDDELYKLCYNIARDYKEKDIFIMNVFFVELLRKGVVV